MSPVDRGLDGLARTTTIVFEVDADAAVPELSAIPSPAAHTAMTDLRMFPPCFEECLVSRKAGPPQVDIPPLIDVFRP